MAKVSITEAARRAGIARSTLYERFINIGKITVETELKDGREHRVIDMAELHRVFGNNLDVSGPDNSNTVRGVRTRTPQNGPNNDNIQETVEVLREQLKSAQDRERWYQGQLETLADTIKLLEHRPAVAPVAVAPVYDPSATARAEEAATEAERIRTEERASLEAERTRSKELEAQLATERSRGFFSRLFNR